MSDSQNHFLPLRIDRAAGLIAGVKYSPSPNHDARPAACVPDTVIIHGISLPPREFGGEWIETLFQNRLDPHAHPYFEQIHALRVSAHVLIRRDGELLQFVPFQLRAWHAGVSCLGQRENCNDFAIGIELEGCDDVPYEDAQYEVLIALLRALRRSYPEIELQRIVGHSDVAPGRKTDPGPSFDWARVRAALAGPA